METIRITVYPEFKNPSPFQPLIDINLDGYIIWMHFWNSPEQGTVAGTYDLVLNGYTIVQNYQPPFPKRLDAGDRATAFIVMFGPTALLCESLHDKDNPLQTPVKPGLVSKIRPPRKVIPATTGKLGGQIPKHNDTLGYFLFGPTGPPGPPPTDTLGWSDPFNPSRWAYDGDQYNPPSLIWTPATSFNELFSFLGPPQPLLNVQGIQFASAAKSPLVPGGPNVLTVQPSGGGPGITPIIALSTLQCEFYDRFELRAALNSWTIPPSGQPILVNDKPISFDAESNLLLDFTQLKFDLTPQKTNPTACTFGEGTPLLITVAEETVVRANSKLLNDYNNFGSAIINNWQELITSVTDALFGAGTDITNTFVVYDPTASPPFSTRLPDYQAAVAAAGVNLGLLNAAFVAAQAAELGKASGVNSTNATIQALQNSFNQAQANLTTSQSALADDTAALHAIAPPGSNPALAGYLQGAINTDNNNITTYTAQMTSLQTQINTATKNAYFNPNMSPGLQSAIESQMETAATAVSAYFAHGAPTPQKQVIPFAPSGQPISKFSYRTVTIANGVWSFGTYSKPS
jgi:hypothetical protein